MVELSPVMERFILHWGEMGTRWGINRTVAQIHALLYLSTQPLHAEQIMATLGVARSNVSTSLKELQGWGIVRVVHVLGDRRDHFESLSDVWQLFLLILEERKKREIDPTIRLLRECLDELEEDTTAPPQVEKRLKSLLGFFESSDRWYRQITRLPQSAVVRFVKLGSRVAKALGVDK